MWSFVLLFTQAAHPKSLHLHPLALKLSGVYHCAISQSATCHFCYRKFAQEFQALRNCNILSLVAQHLFILWFITQVELISSLALHEESVLQIWLKNIKRCQFYRNLGVV